MELKIHKSALEELTFDLGHPGKFLVEHDYYDRGLDEKGKMVEEIVKRSHLHIQYSDDEEAFRVVSGIYQTLTDHYDHTNSWPRTELFSGDIKRQLGNGVNAHRELELLTLTMGWDEWNEISICPKAPFTLCHSSKEAYFPQE